MQPTGSRLRQRPTRPRLGSAIPALAIRAQCTEDQPVPWPTRSRKERARKALAKLHGNVRRTLPWRRSLYSCYKSFRRISLLGGAFVFDFFDFFRGRLVYVPQTAEDVAANARFT